MSFTHLARFEREIMEQLERDGHDIRRLRTSLHANGDFEKELTLLIDTEPVVRYSFFEQYPGVRRLTGPVIWFADERRNNALRGIGLSRFPGAWNGVTFQSGGQPLAKMAITDNGLAVQSP